jgi:hypothetical protein
MPFFSRPWHSMAVERWPVGYMLAFKLLPANTWSSKKIVIRKIPNFLTTIHTYDCKEW